MSQSAHSDVGASSAHRWIPCPGCISLGKTIPGAGSSFFAAEGTGAHALVEKCLILDMDAEEFKGELIHTEGEWKFHVDDDMIAAVQRMLDYVRDIIENVQCASRPKILVEYNVDLSWLRPGMFGTADVIIYDGFTLWVIDYKHGRGYAVEAKGNVQMRYYSLGPCHDFHAPGGGDVVMTIVQPRADHPDGRIRTDIMKKKDLLAWAHAELGPAVDATRKKNPKFCAGEHCRFCRAQAICPEALKRAQASAALDFDEVADLEGEGWEPHTVVTTDEAKLAKIMDAKGYVIGYLNAVEKEVVRRLCAGEKFPGWKRVRGRANRRWRNQDTAFGFLTNIGFGSEELLGVPKMLGPAPVEKLVKATYKNKEERKAVLGSLGQLWEKPPGAPSLVREDDPREAIDPNARPAVPENEFDDASELIFE